MPEDSEQARLAILEAVENQLKENNPPITKKTFDRLKSEGFSAEESKKLISYALASELSDMMNNNELFSEERYSQNLLNLPDLPWEE